MSNCEKCGEFLEKLNEELCDWCKVHKVDS